ncbi:MAG: hypothetical protein WKG00_36470 [Polyangiaceae bacterium]
MQKCDQDFPGATGAAYSVLSCATCGQCFDTCLGSAVQLYCLDGE